MPRAPSTSELTRAAHTALGEGWKIHGASVRCLRGLDPELVERLDVFIAARAVAVALLVRGWAVEDGRFAARVEPVTVAMERFARTL